VNYQILLLQLLPEAVLVLTALVLLGVSVAIEARRGRPVDPGISMGIAAAGIVVAFVALLREPMQAGSGTPLVAVDALGRLAKGILLGFGLLAFLLPPAKREIGHPGEFHALMLFALTGLMLAVGTNHLLFLFVALELAGLSLYLLAGFPRTARAAEASLKYFLFGGVSAAFLLFGLSLLYGFGQSAMLPVIEAKLGGNPGSPLAMAGLLMVLVGIGFKLAVAPFHYWAPDVYQGAPATTVGLVASASKVAGLVVLLRLLAVGFHVPGAEGSAGWGGMAAGWSLWLAVLAAVSMVFGNVLALAQSSVRRVLAYSAVANSGYLLVGFSAGGREAAGAAMFYGVVYGLATFGALAVTAAVERSAGNDSRDAFAGLAARSPWLAVAMLVFLASLAGIPPLAGFVGKFAVFSKALTGSAGLNLGWLVGLAVVMSAVSLYYYLRILKEAWVVEGEAEPVSAGVPLALSISLPALGLVVLGVFPAWLLEPVQAAVALVFGAS
jgi:NADH-quinone oxidoreductase subunit N